MNGFEIAGRPIKVGLVAETGGHGGGGGGSGPSGGYPVATNLDDSDNAGIAFTPQAKARLMASLSRENTSNFSFFFFFFFFFDFSDPLPINLIFFLLPAGLNPLNGKVVTPPPQVVAPNRTILLKNMFDPATESGPDWHLEIQEDVAEECSKYGKVLHCAVERESRVIFLFFFLFPFFPFLFCLLIFFSSSF